MESVYVFLHENNWEDIVIFLSKEDAIKESKKYPKARVEIFSITDESGYTPTYNFYRNGQLIKNKKEYMETIQRDINI
jgi:hypothetical protein